MIFVPKKNIYFPQRKWGQKKFQRGIICAGAIYAAEGSASPEVDATAGNDSNVNFNNPCAVGIEFNTSGSEYNCTNGGTFSTYIGEWLTSGDAEDVWVEFTRTSGTESKWDLHNNGQRYQLSSTQSFEIWASTGGAANIVGYFKFYDAASGGNTLQTTSSATWSARSEIF